MTDKQINQRIAEACGWTEIQDCVWRYHKPWGYPPLKTGQGGNAFKMLPNYCNDLNAMHEAENTILDTDLFYDYCLHLGPLLRATARQRAEAFLRTLGKWNHSGEGTEMVEEVQK